MFKSEQISTISRAFHPFSAYLVKSLTGIGVSFLLLSLSACSTHRVPKDASIVASAEIVQLKGKYRSVNAKNADVMDSATQAVRSGKKQTGSYILGPGDGLTVVINNVPDASYDIVIRPDGFISLPLVDEVNVAGLTPAQLDTELTRLYSKRIVDPELSVIIRSLRQPMVYVLGEVRAPGIIPFRDATSAAEAIARVGDMLPSAYENGVIIIRMDKDGVIKPIAINSISKISKKVSGYQVSPYVALAATPLEPEDILFVPASGSGQLGTDLEQIFKPIVATGNVFSSVLSPILTYKIIKDFDKVSIDAN